MLITVWFGAEDVIQGNASSVDKIVKDLSKFLLAPRCGLSLISALQKVQNPDSWIYFIFHLHPLQDYLLFGVEKVH